MTKHEALARANFLEGYNCAQAVLLAFAEDAGLEKNTALRLASSFGGGVGGMREMCGALSGACMAAGLLFGYDSPDAKEEKAAHYAPPQLVKKVLLDFFDKLPTKLQNQYL